MSALLVTVAAFVLIFGIDKVTLLGGFGSQVFQGFSRCPEKGYFNDGLLKSFAAYFWWTLHLNVDQKPSEVRFFVLFFVDRGAWLID